ncbi:uncharacterized protein [Watersipora subatra]|uniref:uncharacterized protein n=1 Tax=Watersipora subatra TaxID=2589382 RepID=UPI00355C806B
MSKSCRQYYKLTWTPPKHSNSTHGGSCSTAPSSAPSTLSSNVMRSQPVQRIRILKPSGSLTSLTNKDSTCSSLSVKISSTGAKLSNILEDSIDKLDDSVFQTPENTNPYYPNPNTPVDMVCWGICPPNNTPNETTDSEVDLDSSVKRMDWPVTSAVALQRSASVYSSKPLESAKPTTDQRHLKATADWLAEVQSLSIHSSELCASAPIHSSTITGAESLKRSLSNNSACTARSSSHSKKTASRRYTQSRQRMYLKSEGHQAVVRNSREERTFQWHYNKAFEEEGASSTINTSQIISSSVSMRCAYCSSLSHQRAPSEHVSIIAQVGSQSTSCVSLLNDQSEYSDQRTRGSYILRTPASTPQAPANSPQTLQKPFEHFINRLSSSSQALSNDVSRTFNNSLNKDHFCQQNQSYLQHLPLLSPKTYWV